MNRATADPRCWPVSVVVPARNESASLGDTLSEVVAALEAIEGLEWEVVVVDDGSTDGTAEAVPAGSTNGIQLVRHAHGRGYGAAIKSGIKRATHPWILIIDADGTYPGEFIAPLLEARAQDTMVVGARIGEVRHIPWIRRPAKWFLRTLASRLSGTRIVDLNSGMRVFRRDFARDHERLFPDGFSLTSTITLAALASSCAVEYVPIDYRQRKGRSKIRPIRDTIGFLSLIFRSIMFFDPLRVLLPLALLFIVAALAVAVGSYFLTGRLMDVTTVVLLVTGIQILTLGMIADAINRRLS